MFFSFFLRIQFLSFVVPFFIVMITVSKEFIYVISNDFFTFCRTFRRSALYVRRSQRDPTTPSTEKSFAKRTIRSVLKKSPKIPKKIQQKYRAGRQCTLNVCRELILPIGWLCTLRKLAPLSHILSGGQHSKPRDPVIHNTFF